MNRLPFVLPDFTRVIWHSEPARAVWAERIGKVSNAWTHIERQAVVDGARDSCITFFTPTQLPEAAQWAAVRGLVLLPLTVSGVAAQYSATPTAVQPGKPYHFRCALTRPHLLRTWAEVWNNTRRGDTDKSANATIGHLLGYPECCQQFFERVWVQDKGVDTTWQMGVGTPEHRLREWPSTLKTARRGSHAPAGGSGAAGGDVGSPFGGHEACMPEGTPPEVNILLRWLGVRLVPHLPCSFVCSATLENARQFAAVGRHAGYEQEVDWLLEMLAWPAEWSALHGIAEVRTPVLTVSTRTDATADKYVVQRPGSAYPEEGAQGLRFPFRIVQGKVTSKPSFQRSLKPVWELNGFGSDAGMNAAHDVLLQVLPETRGTLLDLGCGTGRLLERAERQGWQVSGVEYKDDAAGAARVSVRRGNLLDLTLWNQQYDVIAFMPGRLLEGCTPQQAQACREALRERAGALLVYAYGDVLARHGGLGPLMAEAGLGACAVLNTSRGDGVEAALVQFTPMEAVATS